MQKVFVETHGCAANFAEGEMIKGLLAKEKFCITENKSEADLIVLNICTVKGNNVAMRAILHVGKEFPSTKLLIAGCVPQEFVTQIKQAAPSASIINTHNIHRIAEVALQTFDNHAVQILGRTREQKIQLPRIRKNPTIAIIPISQGCDSACTFCSVKFIKGNHTTYPLQKIIQEAQDAVKGGCKEIWLTGQDTSCYGLEEGKNLSWLLKNLAQIQGDFKIRLGMANPKHIKNFTDELIEAYNSDKIFKFLHIPVQSGNNEILQKMKRGYTVEEFIAIAKKFRQKFPDITLSTDIICGFPSETKKQFEDTLNLVKELEFDSVNISRFAPRPGTMAAKMQQQISTNEKKERSKKMTGVFKKTAFERNKYWKNWQGEMLIDEQGKHGTYIGRNYAYKLIAAQGQFSFGQKVNVKITEVASTYLKAVVQ